MFVSITNMPQKTPLFKIGLTIATLFLVATIVIWTMTGMHVGWTQTQIPIEKFDPITEISYTTYESGFVAGIDFVGTGIIASLTIAGITYIFARFNVNK